MSLVIVLTFAATLFLLGFITKRRFGVLGLGLCAGALLSQYFANSATGFIQQNGVQLISPPLAVVVAIALVLLPPILLLFGGPKYSSRKWAFVASAVFAVFGVILLKEPISAGLILDSTTKQLMDIIAKYDAILVAIGIALSIVDLMLARNPKLGKHHDK